MNVINTEILYHEGSDITAIHGEMVVEDQGKTIYMYGCWMDGWHDFVLSVTKKSILDVIKKMYYDEEHGDRHFNELEMERFRVLSTDCYVKGQYDSLLKDLIAMICECIVEHGLYDEDLENAECIIEHGLDDEDFDNWMEI